VPTNRPDLTTTAHKQGIQKVGRPTLRPRTKTTRHRGKRAYSDDTDVLKKGTELGSHTTTLRGHETRRQNGSLSVFHNCILLPLACLPSLFSNALPVLSPCALNLSQILLSWQSHLFANTVRFHMRSHRNGRDTMNLF
jgi:hypothetical protein